MLDYEKESTILLNCASGIAPFLAEEVKNLGYIPDEIKATSVSLKGSLNDCIRLNLHLRTAHRVLYLLKRGRALTPDALYHFIHGIHWENILEPDSYFTVNQYVRHSTIRDTRFSALRCKDGIVDRIKETTGKRPDSGPDRSRAAVYLYWKEYDCRIYIDTSGEALSHHSYRKQTADAPMQETLAAAVLIAAGWKGEGLLVNPMCGSGTIAIEAALAAQNRPPGLFNNNYSFMYFKGYQERFYEAQREEIEKNVIQKPNVRILASDIDTRTLYGAKANAKAAGVEELISFQKSDYKNIELPEGPGLILMNPAYGIRMQEDEENLNFLYSEIGDFLKQKGDGYTAGIFTAMGDHMKYIGLKPFKRIPFFNARIECRLLLYTLYSGSKSAASED